MKFLRNFLVGLTCCTSFFAVTDETAQLLEGKRFVCHSMDVHEESLDIPEFFSGGKITNGSVTFLEVNPEMVKVRFDYSIKGFNANLLFHITNAYEKEWMKDIIIGEETEINGVPTQEDPFAVSIGTRVKVKTGLISGKVKGIWLKKDWEKASSVFERKAIKCRIKDEPETVNVEEQEDIFKLLYNK